MEARVDKMRKLLCEVILMRTNDLVILRDYCRENGEDFDYKTADNLMSELQTELTRIVIDCRWHDDKHCSCSPESSLVRLVYNDKELFDKYLYPEQYETLISIVKEIKNEIRQRQ